MTTSATRSEPPEALPIREIAYVVEPSDFPLKVTTQFCISVEELRLANGWSVQSLTLANARTAGYSVFAPGLEITIPPTIDDC